MDGTAQGIQWLGTLLHHSWNFIDNYLVTPIWDSLTYVVHGTLNISKNYVIAPLFRTSKSLLSSTYTICKDYVILPIFRTIKSLIKGTYTICKDYVTVPIFRVLKKLLTPIYRIVTAYVLKPVWLIFKRAVRLLLDDVITPACNFNTCQSITKLGTVLQVLKMVQGLFIDPLLHLYNYIKLTYFTTGVKVNQNTFHTPD
jgi:hypothetical protein